MQRPEVTLIDGDDASGFATMLAQVLEGNVSDYRGRAWVAARARGSVVLAASDRDVAVTLTFGTDGVTIADGAQEGAPVLAGPWLTMAGLCSGSVSVTRSVLSRELEVQPTARLDTLGAAGFVLSVPSAYYGETNRRAQVAAVSAVSASLALLVLAILLLRRRTQTT